MEPVCPKMLNAQRARGVAANGAQPRERGRMPVDDGNDAGMGGQGQQPLEMARRVRQPAPRERAGPRSSRRLVGRPTCLPGREPSHSADGVAPLSQQSASSTLKARPRSSIMRRLMSTAKTTMHPAASSRRNYMLDVPAAIRQPHLETISQMSDDPLISLPAVACCSFRPCRRARRPMPLVTPPQWARSRSMPHRRQPKRCNGSFN